jgi:hypothetical protein
VALVFSVLTAVVVTGAVVAGAIVPENPRLDTPIVLDGEVWAVEQVGNAVVVGGNFTQIQTTRNGPTINQAGLFAYDIDSGILLEDFLPTLSSNNTVEVKAIEPAADGRSVYIGGKFTMIDDHTDDRVRIRNRIAKIDVTTGRLDRNFARGGVDAKVLALDLVGNQLYVGGNYNNIYDTAPGRPPIEHAQTSFARFDATTGAYDASFRFVPQTSIARTGMLGVTNIDHTPDGSQLVVTHRGQDILDMNNNVTYTRPGVVMININGAASVTNFVALFPDPADPDQNMYHRNSCAGRGVFIRDMEVSPDGSFFVLVHQGHDSGYNCDTAVRYPITNAAVRPDWVSRVFDSVFSVGIDDDAVYIGGHFRYMIHPDAPSAYPGRTSPNATGPNCMYCNANTQVQPFRSEMIDTGYVYRAYQIGAINPSTGKGIPTWNPGSDAYKGVLAITVVDRGLLLGQDRGRVNGFNTGRAAFLDQTPDVGNPRCTVALDAGNNPVVSWTDIGNVAEWRIARNDVFLDGTNGTSFTDTDAPVDTDLTYELRFNRNGLSQTDDCGTVRVDLVPIDCVVEVTGDNSLFVDWNNTDADRYTVRRDDKFQATVDDRTRWEDTGLNPGTTYEYEVQAIRNGEIQQSTTCSGTTLDRTLTCSVGVVGEDVTVSFNGGDFSRVAIRRDGNWQATISDQNTFEESLPPGTYSYEATGVVNGFRSTTDCGSATIEARGITCSVGVVGDDVTVSFNGGEFSRVTIRRDGNWQATVSDQNAFSQTLGAGTYAYEATGIFNGFRDTASCGTATVDAEVLVCTLTVQGNNVLLSWNDVGASSYQARTNGSWTATLPDGTTSWTDAGAAGDGNTYQIRFRQDGANTTVNCA